MNEFSLIETTDAVPGAQPQPSKPKRLAKKTREALKLEFERGYAEALERDKGMEMMGTAGVGLVFLALGAALGAWLF